MAQRSFQLSTFIDAPVEDVYLHLSNPKNMIGLQPLLIEMTTGQKEVNDEGQTVKTYETVEAFRVWGKTVYRNRIRVRCVLSESNAQIDNFVQSPGNTQLHFTHLFAEEGTGTRLTLNLKFEAPALLAGFVEAQARAAQTQVFENLKARLKPQEKHL